MKKPAAARIKIAIVRARFNAEITSRLLKSCVAALLAHGLKRNSIVVREVPGSWELPLAAQQLALSKKFQAVIALGAIIKGETPQNDYLAQAVIAGLQQVALSTKIPCLLGVITPLNSKQAIARTRGNLDRGREAALAALEFLGLH